MTAGRKPLGLASRLTVLLAGAFVTVLLCSLLGFARMDRAGAAQLAVRDAWAARLALLGELRLAMTEMHLLVAREVGASGFRAQAEAARSIRDRIEEIRVIDAAYAAAVGTSAEAERFEALRSAWAEYRSAHDAVLVPLDQGDTQAALRMYDEVAQAAYERVEAALALVRTEARRENEAAMRLAEATWRSALALGAAAFGVATLCAAFAIVWTRRQVGQPVLRIAEAMRRLAQGDLAVQVEGASRLDEIGTLAAAVNGYRDSLQHGRRLTSLAELERSRLLAAVDNMPVGLSMFDGDRRLIVCNRAYQELYRLPAELTRPGTAFDVIARQVGATTYLAMSEQRERPSRSFQEVTLPDGRIVGLSVRSLADGGWVSVHEDITERVEAQERVEHMARHDALTGLPNRVEFHARLTAALRSAGAESRMVVLGLDLDRFKQVNDQLGHAAGDLLLRQVASRMSDTVRAGDVVARLGGDEFAILLSNVASPDHATALAQRLVASVSRPYDLDGATVEIGVSIGIAFAPDDADTLEGVLVNADLALYQAKEGGRGRWCRFEPAMAQRLQARRDLERDLRETLATGIVALDFEPRARTEDLSLAGFEAKARWTHPERGVLTQVELMRLAEETGLVRPLGEALLRSACRAASAWTVPLPVAVDVPSAEFHAELPGFVAELLEETGLPGERLELQVHEDVLGSDLRAASDILAALRRQGVRVVLDRFGTGGAAFRSLQRLPFDRLRVDRSFVQGLPGDAEALSILRAIAALAGSLGKDVVVDGVETGAQLLLVRREGCALVQGQAVAPSVTAEQVQAMLADGGSGARPLAEQSRQVLGAAD